MEAAIEGYLEICKLLILQVEDKNPSNNYAAAKNRYLDIYKFIAERVKKNPKDNYGTTPFSKGKWLL